MHGSVVNNKIARQMAFLGRQTAWDLMAMKVWMTVGGLSGDASGVGGFDFVAAILATCRRNGP